MYLPRLYAIVDAETARKHQWTVPALTEALFAAGVRLLQVRGKDLASGELLDVCRRVAGAGNACGATTIVNDRADIARLVPGAGVHVGQDDLPPALARQIVGAGVIVGFSTHSTAQVDAALLEPISYLAVGPVFGTRTKDTGYTAVGLDLVRYAAEHAQAAGARLHEPPIPVVAIGGITLEAAASVVEAGATSVAIISDLFATGDPPARVREYIERLA